MRTPFTSLCLLFLLFFVVVFLTPKCFAQNEIVHTSSLSLYVGWSNEPYVRYRVELDLSSSTQEYCSVLVLLPFPTERTLFCPDDAVCAWQNVYDKLTSMYLVIPPNHTQIAVELQSAPIILLSSISDTRRFVIDFNYVDMPTVAKWLITQNSTIVRFDEIRITFPFTTGMASIDDTPSASRIEGQSRVYTYEDVMTKGGTLTVRYPSPQSSWLIWAETALAGSVGCATAFVMYIATDDERLRKRRRAAWATVVVLWAGTFVLTPMWIVIGEWPWNIILPIWISCVANTIVVTPWIRTLRKQIPRAQEQIERAP